MVLDRFFGNSTRPPSAFEKLDKDHQEKQHDVDDIFGRFFANQPAEMKHMMDSFRRHQHSTLGHLGGGAKVDETEDMFSVSMDVPGVKRDEMTVKLEHAMICINGERKFQNGNHWSASRFHQCFSASSHLDASKATAELSNGVIIVSAPKLEQKAAVEIPIMEGRS